MANTIEKREDGSLRVSEENNEPSRTEQNHEGRINIHKIMERYRNSGTIPVANGTPLYGDFTDLIDFQTAKNRIIEAEKAFMRMPARIRARFDNDPGKMIGFLNDQENKKEAIELGLIVEDPPEPKNPVVEAVEALTAKLTAGAGIAKKETRSS